ncbi:MAG: cytochrome c [Pseudomonadota bacterium]
MKTAKLALFALLAASFSAGVNADPRTLNDAIYTDAQADNGEGLYKTHCLTCHDKKYFRPVLKRWDGQPLGVFYTVMVTSMPESNPGSLSLEEYRDILAYILSLSRYPAGEDELASAVESLHDITIANRK